MFRIGKLRVVIFVLETLTRVTKFVYRRFLRKENKKR